MYMHIKTILGKRIEKELGWRVLVLPIPAFHHCEIHYIMYVCNAGMDALHPNSCFCSFSIATSTIIKFLLLVINNELCF